MFAEKTRAGGSFLCDARRRRDQISERLFRGPGRKAGGGRLGGRNYEKTQCNSPLYS